MIGPAQLMIESVVSPTLLPEAAELILIRVLRVFATRAELAHVIVPVHEGDRGHRRGMSSKATSRPLSLAELRELGQQLRVDSIRASDVKKSGHPTSSMSAADLMAVLFAKYLRYDFDQPENRLNDHLIFSKGHASPLLYSLYLAAGAISEEELLKLPDVRQPAAGASDAAAPLGLRDM